MSFKCAKDSYQKHVKHLIVFSKIINVMKLPKTPVSTECCPPTWSLYWLTFIWKQKIIKWLAHLWSVVVLLLIKITLSSQQNSQIKWKKVLKNNKPSKWIKEVFTKISLDLADLSPVLVLFSNILLPFVYRQHMRSMLKSWYLEIIN